MIPQLCGVVQDDCGGGSVAPQGPILRDGVIVFPAEVQAAIDQVCIIYKGQL